MPVAGSCPVCLQGTQGPGSAGSHGEDLVMAFSAENKIIPRVLLPFVAPGHFFQVLPGNLCS